MIKAETQAGAKMQAGDEPAHQPNLLLQQVQWLDPIRGTSSTVDVWLESGYLRAIAPQLEVPPGADLWDCRGMVLGPGLIDLYSTSAEPGHEGRETLAQLMQAAAAGGFTHLALLPKTQPAIDRPAMVQWLRDRAQLVSAQPASGQPASGQPVSAERPKPLPRLHLWGALTLDCAGQQMTELAELAQGTVGFSDGRPLHALLTHRILEYTAALAHPLALWPHSSELAGSGVAREGVEALRHGLPAMPVSAETAPLSAILDAVESTGRPVHLMRISTARSVELIRQAKAKGLPITASTTWLHLVHNTQDLGRYDPQLRLMPPLGNPADQAALIQALGDRTLDAIAIDHRAYTYEEKTVAFAEAPPGSVGLATALIRLWQGLVEPGHLSSLELWQALTTGPSRCLHWPAPELSPGDSPDLTLFDPRTGETHTFLGRLGI